MANAITPSKAKLESKGVKSVSSRITTLSQHLDMNIEQFKAYVIETMCDGELKINANDIEQINSISQSYLEPEFIMGNNPRCNMRRKERIDGVGELEVSFELVHNIIRNINVTGDFFLIGDIDISIIDRLNGASYTRESINQALKGIDVSDVIMNLTNKQFINLLINF